MKTLGAHWKPIENLVRTHIGNMIGMMVGHPHLQLNVGMCVHSYNLCVWNKQWKFLGWIQLRNASKLTFQHPLQSVHSNWVYESKANNYFLVDWKNWPKTHDDKPIFEICDDSDSKCEGKGFTLFPSLIPWWGSRTEFWDFKILALSTGFTVL